MSARDTGMFSLAENVGYFSVKTIGLSEVNGRKPCTLLQAASHNLREIQAELGADSRIDAQRMAFNIRLAGPETVAEVVALAKQFTAQLEAPPIRRDHVQAVEAVFSLHRSTPLDTRVFFVRCLDWLTKETRLPVLLATIHMDEEHPHLHVLLMPVKDGRHIGGSLNTKAELKRLRDLFDKQVATPAGLKHSTAKLYGQAKKWAMAAVLRQCEAMGLPAANGVLWPVWVRAIERDPTEAMGLLKIDANSIRPREPIPIGIEGNPANPIGIGLKGVKTRSLSCVGIALPTPAAPAPKAAVAMPATAAKLASVLTVTAAPPAPAIDTRAMLWARVGCRVPLVARQAQQRAMDRHRTPARRKAAPVTVRMDEDGYTRVRDEHAHDTSAWN